MRCEVLIDWLTFTVKAENPNEVISDWLGMDSDLFQETGLSLNGYQNVKMFSDIRVCSQPRENRYFKDLGVCVSMSGNGCRAFEQFSRLAGTPDSQGEESKAFLALFQRITADSSAHITRIDVACDEKDGTLDMSKIIKCVENGEVNSRLKKRRVVFDKDCKKDDGSTVYIGSASSDFRFRIYDKAAEQGIDSHWIRVEMVLRGKNANGFASELVNGDNNGGVNGHGANVGKLAAQILNDKLSFIILDDKNISRCSVCSWWLDFVDELGKVHLVARCAIQHSVEHLADWIGNQVAPTLYILAQTLGFPFVYKLALAASGRLSEKQEALIRDWNSIIEARKDTGSVSPQVAVAI